MSPSRPLLTALVRGLAVAVVVQTFAVSLTPRPYNLFVLPGLVLSLLLGGVSRKGRSSLALWGRGHLQ
jgi:hypothetical protein